VKLKSPIIILLTVLMVLQGALFGLPAFAAGTNLPNVTNYGVYNYVDSNTVSPTVIGSEVSTGNDGVTYTPPPWPTLQNVPYIFSDNVVIGIRFAVNVVPDAHWSANQGCFHMYDASNNPVAINVIRSGDGTSSDVNRNYIYLVPQNPLQPSSTYKIIIDANLTANNGQQAGKQQEVDFTTVADTTRPTWTSGTLTVSSVASTSLTLSWSGASDDAAVAGYKIYANGSLIATVSGPTTIYNVTGLNAGTAYSFQVQALDAAGNESLDGPTATAATEPASGSVNVSLTLSRSSVPVKSSVTASGTAAPNTWVSIKVVDGSSPNPLYYNAVKSDASGNYKDTFRVPAAPGTLTVVAGYGNNVATAKLTATALTGVTSDVTVTGDSNKNLEITGSTPSSVNVTIPTGVTGASVSVSDLLGASGSGVASSALPALNITAGATINSAPVQVAVTIPAGTTVSAPAGWDGTINLPTVQTASQELASAVASSGTVSAVIEIGYGDTPLTFSQPVRILIPGQAGKGVGYYRDGKFTTITNHLSSDSGAALVDPNVDGWIDSNNDLVVWTKHFTQFVTYTPTGSDGTGGGGGSSGGDIQAPTWPNKTFKTATKVGQVVTLEWYPATDNVGVAKYRIYHGSEQIGEVDGNITRFTYTQPTGTGQGSQPYSVQAGDAAGNWSTDGPSVTLGGSNLPLIVEYGVYSYDPGSNTTPPTPIGSVLTSGTLTGVPTTFSGNTAIGIKFATNVATSTYFSSNRAVFRLLDASGNSVSIKVDRSGDGTSSDVNRNYLFVIPQVALKPGSSYRIVIGPTLTSNNGMSAGVQQEIDFTTAGSPETSGSSGAITTNGPTITTGSASVDPAVGATVGLGDNARIVIPANALKGTSSVTVTVKEVTSPPAVPSGFKIAGKVYEFTIDGQSNYTFNTKVGITLSFDPSALSSDETAAVFYYDETKQEWVNLGGTISGNTITVNVDHFTKFAVFAVKKTAAPAVQPGTLTDIAGHWAEAGIRKLVELGAVSGYPDGTFKPDSTITRAEFATVLVKAFKLDLRTARLFKDTVGHWARDYISTAAVFGIVNGYDTDTFGPDDLISREQMAAMIVRAAKLELINEETKFADRADISEWARSAVATAVKNGIIKGYTDNTFRPQGNATRAEAATVIMNALNLNK